LQVAVSGAIQHVGRIWNRNQIAENGRISGQLQPEVISVTFLILWI